MQWQTHFDFVIGASVAMCALKNRKSEKEDRQAEDAGNSMIWIAIYTHCY